MVGMRFSLRWLFLATTYVALVAAAVAIGESWMLGFWMAIAAAILLSHIRWVEGT
jgi:uncharacterized membrane protein YvlD (DUF360 family)